MNCSDDKSSYRILTCYYRSKPGGFCKRLFRGIRALIDRGCIVHYLAVVPFPINHPNCHFHRFPWPEQYTSGYMFWGIFHLLAPLMLLCIGLKYRINRLFAFGHNYSLLLQPLRLVRRLPLVLFLRADTIRNHQIKKRPAALIVLEHILEGLGIAGTRMHAVSEELSRTVNARHKVLRPALSEVLRNETTIKDASRKKRPFVLPLRAACVGVLEPRKNQKFLLDVFKEIAAEQAQLYFYGIGPNEQLLRKIAHEENMTNRVHFMGWVQTEQIWPRVDILLMPSLHEGAPNAVLEALSFGIPVLASDIPEHREILPREHLMSISSCMKWISFLNEDIKKITEKIKKIYNDQELSANKLSFNWEEYFVTYIIK